MMTNATTRVAAAGALLAAGLAGCSSEQKEASAEVRPRLAWSTKDQSRIGADPTIDPLVVTDTIDIETVTGVRAGAVDLLLQAADSTNPMLRANAIEALHGSPEDLERAVRIALGDENRGVRFVAAMTVGKKDLCELAPLVEPLLDDESQSVEAAAIFALRRCGRMPNLNPLAEMVLSPDPEIRANAAMVLGRLGDPTAMPMLRQAMRQTSPRVSRVRNRIVELQIAEAMVRLGDESAMDVIRAALFAPTEREGELTVLACMLSGELGDAAYAAALGDMAIRRGRRQEPAEVRLAATVALARLDPGRAPREVAVEYVSSCRFQIRAQAASALGWSPAPATGETLRAMLDDPNPMVQVAAAGAVLRVTRR
jgi:HEAT repeat protein